MFHVEHSLIKEAGSMTVPIPPNVRDNSEKVTDYAFMRHLSPNPNYHRVIERDGAIDQSRRFDSLKRLIFTWYDTNPDGQRCRFDMITDWQGTVVNLFHTEYFTRVACETHPAYYAVAYASITDQEGVTTIALPYCDECLVHLRRSAEDTDMTFNLSEPLIIGQFDYS